MLAGLDAVAMRLARARGWVQRLVLALLAALLFLPGLASLPVTDRDEARFVQASRQMAETGDLIDIRFQEAPRHKKPAGIYWAQAGAISLWQGLGGQGAPPLWVHRAPSYLAAIAAVVLVQAVAAPLIGAPGAFWAALTFAGTLVLAGEARIAKTDALLLALILGAQAVLAALWAGRARAGLAWAFWGALGASVIVKGPIGPMVVGLTALAVSAARREARWLAPLARRWPLGLGLALALPWYVAITLKSGGGFWAASLGEDLLAKVGEGQEGKGAPFGTYALALWLTFWPGALVLALALPGLWRARARKALPFLLAWLVPAWLVFEAVSTKLIHYVLPLYPALAILAVLGWQARPKAPGWPGLALAALFLALGPGLLGALLWGGFATGAGLLWPAALALPVVLGLGYGLFRALRADLRGASVALVLALGAATHAGLIAGLARWPWLWPSEAALSAARAALPESCTVPRLVSIGHAEPSLVVRFGAQTVFADLASAPGAVQQAGPCAVLLVREASADAAVAALQAAGLALSQPVPIAGFALGAGRAVALRLYTQSF